MPDPKIRTETFTLAQLADCLDDEFCPSQFSDAPLEDVRAGFHSEQEKRGWCGLSKVVRPGDDP
jgi:hypothetical protein